MGGATNTNDQNLVDYSGRGAKPAGARGQIPAGHFDSQGRLILSAAQRAEDAQATKIEQAYQPKPVTSQNFFGRDTNTNK